MLGISALGQLALGQFFKNPATSFVSKNLRAYVGGFDTSNNITYRFVDVTGAKPVDSLGNPLNK